MRRPTAMSCPGRRAKISSRIFGAITRKAPSPPCSPRKFKLLSSARESEPVTVEAAHDISKPDEGLMWCAADADDGLRLDRDAPRRGVSGAHRPRQERVRENRMARGRADPRRVRRALRQAHHAS